MIHGASARYKEPCFGKNYVPAPARVPSTAPCERQTKMIAQWFEAGTGQPAHPGLVKALMRMSDAELHELKDATAFIVESVVLRYLQEPDARPTPRTGH